MLSIARSLLFSRAAKCSLRCISYAFLVCVFLAARSDAQDNGKAANADCVSAEMVHLLAREGNSVRVSSSRELLAEGPGSEENEKGIALAQSSETARTLREAHTWFEKGARKGYAPAQVNLAVLSLAGWGARPNAGIALYWLREAARQGYALANFDLGILYLHGCGVRQDYHEAFTQFEQGASGGDSAAELNLGYLYDQGLGVTKDQSLAALWYRKAAESGVPQAQYNLADLFVRGEGVPRDETAAFAWFQKAAQQGHSGACIMLGTMYAEGRGTEKDLQSAYAWLSAASLEGDTRGSATLDRIELQLDPVQLAQSKRRAQTLARRQNQTGPSELAFLY
jgi:TPR repeat protein